MQIEKFIEMNEALIDVFFGGMDSECLEQIKKLEAEGGLLLNIKTGGLVRKCIGQHIYTDYFKGAYFFVNKAYSVGDEQIYYVTKDNNELVKLDNCPRGNDGWSELEDGTRVWQLQIEVDEDEWESYPVWFEDKDKAYIFFNNN